MLVKDYLNGESWLVCPFHGKSVRLQKKKSHKKSEKQEPAERVIPYTGGGIRRTRFACGCICECDC